MSVTIRKATAVEKGRTFKTASCFVVEKGGQRVGIIVKHKNTKTDIHPYKIFRDGQAAPIGTFYDDADSVTIGPSFDYERCKIGGKAAAFIFARKSF